MCSALLPLISLLLLLSPHQSNPAFLPSAITFLQHLKIFFFFKFNKPLSAKYIYHVLFCVLIVSTNVLNSSKVKPLSGIPHLSFCAFPQTPLWRKRSGFARCYSTGKEALELMAYLSPWTLHPSDLTKLNSLCHCDLSPFLQNRPVATSHRQKETRYFWGRDSRGKTLMFSKLFPQVDLSDRKELSMTVLLLWPGWL